MMNMKTLKTSIFAATFALAALVSCTSQDDIYKEFVKDGGLIYPAKAADVKSETGFNKVTLSWLIPKDPSVKSARVYWDNKTDSIDLNYSDFTDTVKVSIVDLDDRSYTFSIVNFDKLGNRSMTSELTATPYGKNWLSTHEERQFKQAWADGTTATVQLTEATIEMVATKFRYKNLDGEWVEYGPRMTPREVNFKLPNAMRGKYIQFCSGFLPSDGRDTAWMDWTKSTVPVRYPLDTKGWTVTATDGITVGNRTADKLFDGVKSGDNNAFFCKKNAAVKIVAVDTHAEEGHYPTFQSFTAYLSATMGYRIVQNVYIYVGDKPYDPNDKNWKANFGTPMVNNTTYWWGDVNPNRGGQLTEGRYIAYVISGVRGKNFDIRIYELEPWGFILSDAN